MAAYVFAVDRIEVHNCKSKGQHNDSDWLHTTVAIGEQTPVDTNFLIGANIHAGDSFNGPWIAGPFEIDDNSRVLVSYLIENKSHTDAEKQESQVIAVGTAIVAGLFGISSAEASAVGFDSESVADAVAAAVVGAAGAVWATLVGNSNPDCNGEVLTRALSFDRGDLRKLGTHTIADDERTGPSKEDCGNPPRTKVTYSVRVWTLREALITKGFNLSQTFRVGSIQPPVTSVRSFMGFHH
ncbi:MAG TPA: hypothetical protein VH369_01430 [Bryobacteraceae bacterium]|jgi:hypothetical protein